MESLPTGELRCIICSVKMNSRECANAHIMGTPSFTIISNLVRVLPVLVPRTTVLVLCTTSIVYYWYRVLLVPCTTGAVYYCWSLPYFLAVSLSIQCSLLTVHSLIPTFVKQAQSFFLNAYFSHVWKNWTNSAKWWVLFRTGISVFDIGIGIGIGEKTCLPIRQANFFFGRHARYRSGIAVVGWSQI